MTNMTNMTNTVVSEEARIDIAEHQEKSPREQRIWEQQAIALLYIRMRGY